MKISALLALLLLAVPLAADDKPTRKERRAQIERDTIAAEGVALRNLLDALAEFSERVPDAGYKLAVSGRSERSKARRLGGQAQTPPLEVVTVGVDVGSWTMVVADKGFTLILWRGSPEGICVNPVVEGKDPSGD